jgi:hypothetical protein
MLSLAITMLSLVITNYFFPCRYPKPYTPLKLKVQKVLEPKLKTLFYTLNPQPFLLSLSLTHSLPPRPPRPAAADCGIHQGCGHRGFAWTQ